MMRRSCCVYATGIIATHLLIVGIALMIADVFPRLITKKLKGVSLLKQREMHVSQKVFTAGSPL